MLEGSVLIKLWRHSFFLRLINTLWAVGSRAGEGSKIIAFLIGEGPGWLKGSYFGRLVQGGVHFLMGLVQKTRQWLVAAAGESRALVLVTGESPCTAGFIFSLLLGLGVTLLVGAAVRGGAWWALAVLLLVGTGLVARLWPRRREIWGHSLTARIWANLTAIDD